MLTTANERALLSCLMGRLGGDDPDAIVTHNGLGFDLDVLLTRAAALKVGAPWSKLGRLRRLRQPHRATYVHPRPRPDPRGAQLAVTRRRYVRGRGQTGGTVGSYASSLLCGGDVGRTAR